MKFQAIIAVLALCIGLLPQHGSAQCPNSISVSSQEQMENLMAEYPDCQEIPGYLVIRDDVTDLAPLSNLTSVGTYMSIHNTTQLTSLSGLEGITSVGTDLRINNNSALASLSGLGGVTTVGEDLEVLNNPQIPSLEGLGAVSSVAGQVYLFNNAAMTSIDGLTSLSNVGTKFRISSNSALTSIVGPANLTVIPEELSISFNEATEQILFPGLTTVGEVTSNSNSGSFELPALKHAQDIWLGGAGGITKVDFTALQTVEDYVYIGLRTSLTEFVGGDALQSVGAGFLLSSSMVVSPPFVSLVNIGGDLTSDSRDAMIRFNSMEALTSVGGSIYFVHQNGLEEINAFNSLVSVGGEVEIRENDEMTKLNAFASLETVTEDFYISFNESLSDCFALCQFLENGTAGNFRILGNGEFGTACYNEANLRDACDSPFDGVRIIDANPALLSEQTSPIDDVRSLDASQLIGVDLDRAAVAADGVSELVIIAEFKEPGAVSFTSAGEPLEQPWGTQTIASGGAHYGFAVYQAPEEFNGTVARSEGLSLYHGVESASVAISIEYTGEEAASASANLTVLRPPVVLVHGTYSDPETAWHTAAEGSQSMYQVLTDAGLKVFTVDYESTNGDSDSGPSSFEDNKMVVWENPGGIKEALDHYRNEMDAAVTQADVVGHSLGGVLPRVYASGQYHPEYIRAENFFEGDINRLITLGATHFGSHLGELQAFLEDASIFDIGPLEWIVAQGQAFITSWFTGTPASPAVRDQLPPPNNEALAKLGRTEIPAHAITLSVDRGMLKSPAYDPHEEYFDLYWYISLLLYHNDDLRELYLDYKLTLAEMGYKASTTLDGGDPQELFPGYDDLMLFKQMIEDGLRYSGQLISILDGTFELPSDIEILHWVMSEVGMGDIADPLLQIYQFGSDPAGVVAKYFRNALMPDKDDALNSYLTVYDENMEALRALVFNNDKNDGVVRVESQSGELEDECADCVTHYENVLHGFAPRYPEVQQGLTALLKGGMEQFHADGFPPVDDGQLLYYPEKVSELFKIPVTGPPAICRSGMVPAHAEAFARVADEQNAIIIARPVNPDGLPLIQRGAATKVMDVKPKSSNWGPQRGYLPSRQRYSKLWKVFEGSKRDEMISKYDGKVTENLTEGITVDRHLTVNVCNGTYEVFIDENKNTGMMDMSAEDEVVLVPVQNNNQVCFWQTNATGQPQEFSHDMTISKCIERTSEHFLTEFKVMATPEVFEEDGVTPRFLTADYDLLMIGFYEGQDQGAPAPPDVDFLPGVGQITPEQQDLVSRLNQEVANTGYDGGNVTHHGPENQFGGSPYVDYPVTVFAPDEIPNGFFSGSQGGKILSIDMGPAGFRDIHLKRFINRMREEGYDLYANPTAPGWHWEWDDDIPGYQLEDSDQLVDYVEQLPDRGCSKPGGPPKSVCDQTPRPDASPAMPESWLRGRTPGDQFHMQLRTSVTSASNLVVNITTSTHREVQLVIRDALGNPRSVHTRNLWPGQHNLSLDIGNLPPGIYWLSIPDHPGLRFVRV